MKYISNNGLQDMYMQLDKGIIIPIGKISNSFQIQT
jgi:hypothetical protein